MKNRHFYPAFINWPFLVLSILVGGSSFLGLLIAVLALAYEMIRVSLMIRRLDEHITLDQIQSYYSRDKAHKWIPWRDQIRGINAMASLPQE